MAASLLLVIGYCEQCFSKDFSPSGSAGAAVPVLDWPARPHPPVCFHDPLLVMNTRTAPPPTTPELCAGAAGFAESFIVPVDCNCARAGAAASNATASRATSGAVTFLHTLLRTKARTNGTDSNMKSPLGEQDVRILKESAARRNLLLLLIWI